MSLSSDEIKAITESWNVVYAKKAESGMVLFLRLYSENPDVIPLFRILDGVSADQYKTHAPIQALSIKVLDTLNPMIENLSNTDVLVQMLSDLGKSHIKRNTTAAHFDALGPCIIYMLEQQVPDFAAKDAWLKGWGIMKSVIVKQLPKTD